MQIQQSSSNLRQLDELPEIPRDNLVNSTRQLGTMTGNGSQGLCFANIYGPPDSFQIDVDTENGRVKGAFWTILEGIALLLNVFAFIINMLFKPALGSVVALSGFQTSLAQAILQLRLRDLPSKSAIARTPALRRREFLLDLSSPDFTDYKEFSEMLEIKRTSTLLPEPYIFRVACTALEELWTVEIQPDILVDSSIALSHAARKILWSIAVQLTYHQRLLLCCIKWEFSANEAIDQSWAFYFGQGDQDLSNPVQRYNAQTRNKINIEFASSCFAQIKDLCEAGLRKKYWYSMNVARTFLQLGALLHSDAEYVEYLCNQSLVLRDWYEEMFGWSDTHRSIVELEKMTTKSEDLSTPASFQQAFELATVAYCGLVIQENLPARPIPTIKGCTNFEVDPVIMDDVKILHKQTTSFGEQSVWQTKDRENEITIFIEVLVPEKFPGHYQQVEALVRNYWSLLLPLSVAKQCTANQEIRDYICIVFYYYWIDLDLSTVVDPGSGAKTPDERRVAAQELGLLARQGLGYFLLMVVQDVRWDWETQIAIYPKEVGCASTIQPYRALERI
ncbi:hypothetical protein WAI453_006500 [Rhynchosporium graminicola]